MQPIYFIVNFLILTFTASLAILGLYGATRWRTVTIDGKEVKKGKILYPYYLFWNQKKAGEYMFSEKIRDVMVNCITCMPTVYGNLIFWTFILSMKDEALVFYFVYPFTNPICGIIEMWLTFWLSCSYLCTILWRLNEKLK